MRWVVETCLATLASIVLPVIAPTWILSPTGNSATLVHLPLVATEEQPSGSGGIGNTRSDILEFWGLNDSMKAGEDLIEEHIQYSVYDRPDVQIGFMFQLEDDNQARPTDRAIDIILGLIDVVSYSYAEDITRRLVPADAAKQGVPEVNSINESIQLYVSQTMAETVPYIDHEYFEVEGDIWVTYWPTGPEVWVIELSLFYPRED